MENQIFISYRRDGGETLAMLLHDRLKEAGYRVFLDVESLRSGKFNEQLLQVMDSCTDVLLILPPGGLDRCFDENDWVRREIVHAIRQKKNIIPIMMRNFTFPKDLPEDLREIPNYNGLEANMAMFPETMQRLMGKFLLSQPDNTVERSGNNCHSGDSAASDNAGMTEPEFDNGSIDQALSARFEEIFRENNADPQERYLSSLSPIARKLAQKEHDHEIAEYFKSIKKMSANSDDSGAVLSGSDTAGLQRIDDIAGNASTEFATEPDSSWHERLDVNSDGCPLMKGKYFTFGEVPATKNLVYIVRKKYDNHALSKYYEAELLDSELVKENGECIRYYSIDHPDKYGNPLIHIHFNDRDGCTTVNMGFLDWGVVRLSRMPIFLKCMILDSDSENEIRTAEVTTGHLTEEEIYSLTGKRIKEKKEIWKEADLQSGIIMIDPETGNPVLREPYYDAATRCWKAKVKLRVGHQYLAFTVQPRKDGSESPWLTPLEIGTLYSTGSHGFPLDVVKAAQYLEKDNSADARYQLAMIFLRESEFRDLEFGRQLLRQAADEGSKDAKLQIALDIILDICLRDDSSSLPRLKELLGDKNAGTTGAGKFLRAFALETQILTQDPIVESWVKPEMNAFEIGGYLYVKSACSHYLPAMLRLKCWKQEEFYYNPLCEYYRQTSDEEHSLAFFALACAVLYGQGFCANTADGLALLEYAAANGSKEAVAELEYYLSNHSGRRISSPKSL